MGIGGKEVEETAEGEHREPRGFLPALRTSTFNTQVEKKQAKEVRMKRERRETRKTWYYGGQEKSFMQNIVQALEDTRKNTGSR